ncbi:MAG: LysR family transcriptional regulator [Gammaproteobacteria bacterium]|nr:LysR family transcriptional regulator [Gammaproteobacteria bacterium]MAY03399.1 LysR family transcriptional regulator [Gammaproteobacteria bacterium]|tara:strand:+ start:377 stop:1372 length:996 start_codon:yes stop_codon:yes gene_type:complete
MQEKRLVMTADAKDRNKPSIRQLEYFVTIALSSNFRKAAQVLNISQPTLTSQIAVLEDALKVKLFERSRAGTLLSPAGRELLPLVRQLLEQYQQVLDHADSSRKELSGTFKIGVSPTIGPYLFSKVLIELHKRYPQLKLHVREGVPQELEQGLDRGDYDFILTMLPMHSSENRVRPLFIEPISLVMSRDHPLAQKDELVGKDLYNQEVLTMDERHHLHRQIATLCERYTAHAQRRFASNSLNTLKQMVIMNMGIAFMPGLYIHARIMEEDQLKVMDLRDEKIRRTHVASWRKNAPSRHLFQKISYDIKTIAMELFDDILEEVNTEDNPDFK